MTPFWSRLKWVHLIPVVILFISCMSVYMLTKKLASEIQASDSSTNGNDNNILSLPHSLEEARVLSLRLSTHLRTHPSSRFYLVLLFSQIYLLKQTFSIPGSALLNIMTGFVFGPLVGVPYVAFLTAAGASGCYMLSRAIGTEFISAFKPLRNKVAEMTSLIAREKQQGTLFVYLLIVRIFPLTPNWLLNLSSPLVGIPFTQFFASVFIGLLPYIYVTVTAGDTLHSLSVLAEKNNSSQPLTLSDCMDNYTMIKLSLLAISLLVPTLLKRYLAKKTDEHPQRLKL